MLHVDIIASLMSVIYCRNLIFSFPDSEQAELSSQLKQQMIEVREKEKESVLMEEEQARLIEEQDRLYQAVSGEGGELWGERREGLRRRREREQWQGYTLHLSLPSSPPYRRRLEEFGVNTSRE